MGKEGITGSWRPRRLVSFSVGYGTVLGEVCLIIKKRVGKGLDDRRRLGTIIFSRRSPLRLLCNIRIFVPFSLSYEFSLIDVGEGGRELSSRAW